MVLLQQPFLITSVEPEDRKYLALLTQTEQDGYTPQTYAKRQQGESKTSWNGLIGLFLEREKQERNFKEGVHFNCRRSNDEYYSELEDIERYHFRALDDLYFRNVELFLHDMGIVKAEVDFVRNKGKYVRGSTRIPLLVSTPDEQFVVKKYDDYDHVIERKVLETVSGNIGAKIRAFSKDMYAEEFIDFNTMPTLFEQTNGLQHDCPEMEMIVLEAAVIYAQLAKKEINYNHQKCMDEFRSNFAGIRKITDFGTSRLFYDESYFSSDVLRESEEKLNLAFSLRKAIPMDESEAHKKLEIEIVKPAFSSWNERRECISLLGILTDKGGHALFELKEQFPVEYFERVSPHMLVNSYFCLDSAKGAMRSFFECRQSGWSFDKVSGYDLFRPFEQKFIVRFLEEYLLEQRL